MPNMAPNCPQKDPKRGFEGTPRDANQFHVGRQQAHVLWRAAPGNAANGSKSKLARINAIASDARLLAHIRTVRSDYPKRPLGAETLHVGRQSGQYNSCL